MSYKSLADQWRNDAGYDNPAGPLFASGEFATADIVAASDMMTLTPACQTIACGTACSGSGTHECC
jgi:hypothetical protein